MASGNKPLKEYRAGLISLNLWENVSKEGEKFNSFTFKRLYKDKEEKWQTTQSLRISDLPKIKILVEEAYKDLIFSEKEIV